MSQNETRHDLPSLVKQTITGHPGYAEFAAWCQSQLIRPCQIYFLIWQASREALVVELEVPLSDAGAILQYAKDRDAIAAAGLKVKP